MTCTLSSSTLKRLLCLGAGPILLSAVCSYVFFDKSVAFSLRSLPDTLDRLMEVLTMAGLSTPYLVMSACLFLLYRFVRKQKIPANRALFVFLSVSSAGIVNLVLKFVMGRYRPRAFLESGLYGFSFFQTEYISTSFPSGHANTAGALMACLALLFPRYRVFFLGGALLIAFTRVALCAHFLSDALCGVYLGGLVTVWVGLEMEKRGLTLLEEHGSHGCHGER